MIKVCVRVQNHIFEVCTDAIRRDPEEVRVTESFFGASGQKNYSEKSLGFSVDKVMVLSDWRESRCICLFAMILYCYKLYFFIKMNIFI